TRCSVLKVPSELNFQFGSSVRTGRPDLRRLQNWKTLNQFWKPRTERSFRNAERLWREYSPAYKALTGGSKAGQAAGRPPQHKANTAAGGQRDHLQEASTGDERN
ncbi:hypothetical protein Bbelb_430410, partial [Branchiostoma belcheri]